MNSVRSESVHPTFAVKTTTALSLRGVLSNSFVHVGCLCALMLWFFLMALDSQRAMAGTVGFAMDDSWIHVAVARNFAQGQGWGIIPGKVLSVSTSPTWTLLLSFFFLFFINPLKIAFLCSVGSMAVACVSCYFLTLLLTERKSLAFLSGVLLVSNPISIWGVASGLELPLALAALMLALYAFYATDPDSTGRRVLFPVACVFAAITRPELFVLIPLALSDTCWCVGRKRGWACAIRNGLIQSAVVLLALLPYLALNLYSHGKIFPATYYAKTIVRGVGLSAAIADGSSKALWQSFLYDPLRQVSQIVSMLAGQNIVMLLLLTPALLAFTKSFATKGTSRGLLLPLAVFVVPWVMGMGSPSRLMSNHADRYFVIFPPLVALMCCVSLYMLLEHGRQRGLVALCALLLLLAPIRTLHPVLRHIGIDAESTQRLYVEMPVWLHDNLDPNARLAVNDIGGIAYYAPRNLIDVMGLASPEIWPAISRGYGKPVPVERMKAYLREQKIEYVILSPRYYPDLTSDTKTFEPVRSWREGYEHGRTISPQVLYKVHW